MPSWIGNTLAAFLILGIFSFLYKDNPWYKFCEALFIGISAGYWFVTQFYQSLLPKLFDTLWHVQTPDSQAAEGAIQAIARTGRFDVRILYFCALILGVMMLLRLVPSIGWISRWPIAFIVGSTAGLNFITYLNSNVMKQLEATIRKSLINPDFAWYIDINAIVVIVGTATGLIYFYFSKEHKGAFGAAARVGIYFLMVTFGASFGYTVMSRMSLLIGRLDFLFGTWLGLI